VDAVRVAACIQDFRAIGNVGYKFSEMTAKLLAFFVVLLNDMQVSDNRSIDRRHRERRRVPSS